VGFVFFEFEEGDSREPGNNKAGVINNKKKMTADFLIFFMEFSPLFFL
jgi:hypothetical protein